MTGNNQDSDSGSDYTHLSMPIFIINLSNGNKYAFRPININSIQRVNSVLIMHNYEHLINIHALSEADSDFLISAWARTTSDAEAPDESAHFHVTGNVWTFDFQVQD